MTHGFSVEEAKRRYEEAAKSGYMILGKPVVVDDSVPVLDYNFKMPDEIQYAEATRRRLFAEGK